MCVAVNVWIAGRNSHTLAFVRLVSHFFNHFVAINHVALSLHGLHTTVDGMVSCGSTKRKIISLHQLFLRATNARKPLKPACSIPCVVRRISLSPVI